MVLVDTCGWIEWLTDGVLSDSYLPYFESVESLLVPTSVQFELYKWVKREKGVQLALESIALTEQANVSPLTTSICLFAADLSIENKLSFADSIIYATAQFKKCELVTSDSHFKELPGVIYLTPKRVAQKFIPS